jgi:[ribosomal protein S18]-alanine N-acetyltransferase
MTTIAECHACATLMSGTDPWLRFGTKFDTCLATVSDPTKELYGAYTDDVLVGFLLLDMRGLLRGYIQTLCVSSEARGQGSGTLLLAAVEERIHRDSPNVFMCVSSFNTGARRLYERLGYEVVGTLTDYVVAGHDELLLRKATVPWSQFTATPVAPAAPGGTPR